MFLTMKKRFELRLTELQRQLLEARATTAGFTGMAEYIRYVLFAEENLVDKIVEIHERVCNGK